MPTDDENKSTEKAPNAWDSGRRISALDTSEADLSDLRKKMIRFALDYPIHDVRTYAGYKGDLIVEITTSNISLLEILKNHAQSLGMETVIKEKKEIQIHEIYCISPDDSIYKLKEPSEDDHRI